MRPIARLALVVSLVAVASARGQEDETREEVWPEIDAYVRLSSSMKLFGLAAFSSARNESASEGQYGIHWDISWKRLRHQLIFNRLTDRANDEKMRPLTFRVGYRYSSSIQHDGDPSRENRGVLEAHVRWPTRGGLLLSDRNRLDLRWVNGVYSWRYRNRVLLERETAIGGYHITPYTSGEIFYDSRYDEWNRTRFCLGIQAPLHPRAMLDTYYARQHDTRSEPAYVNALGLALNVFF
jgi:Protein of unknown function (DUF2490)